MLPNRQLLISIPVISDKSTKEKCVTDLKYTDKGPYPKFGLF
jgi:hypothetical protein